MPRERLLNGRNPSQKLVYVMLSAFDAVMSDLTQVHVTKLPQFAEEQQATYQRYMIFAKLPWNCAHLILLLLTALGCIHASWDVLNSGAGAECHRCWCWPSPDGFDALMDSTSLGQVNRSGFDYRMSSWDTAYHHGDGLALPEQLQFNQARATSSAAAAKQGCGNCTLNDLSQSSSLDVVSARWQLLGVTPCNLQVANRHGTAVSFIQPITLLLAAAALVHITIWRRSVLLPCHTVSLGDATSKGGTLLHLHDGLPSAPGLHANQPTQAHDGKEAAATDSTAGTTALNIHTQPSIDPQHTNSQPSTNAVKQAAADTSAAGTTTATSVSAPAWMPAVPTCMRTLLAAAQLASMAMLLLACPAGHVARQAAHGRAWACAVMLRSLMQQVSSCTRWPQACAPRQDMHECCMPLLLITALTTHLTCQY